MTTKSQLNACRDALMAGMRAATRGANPDESAGEIIRACLDLVEHSLSRDPAMVTAVDVGTTLAVLERASVELGSVPTTPPAASASIQNACQRLRLLMGELAET